MSIPSKFCSMSRPVANTMLTGITHLIRQPKCFGPSCLAQQTRNMRMYKEKTCRIMYWRARSFDAVKYPERRRDERQEWNYRSEIFAFSRRLQENLSEDNLRRIFAHPSYVDKLQQNQLKLSLPALDIKSNKELVHRGEQLLDECIRPYLRYMFRRMPEDGVDSITNYLKSEDVLADVAKWIGCKDIILTTEWPPNPKTMANTVLALIAGIESDLGSQRVQRFVVDILLTYLNDKDLLDDVWHIPNPKETLRLILKNSSLPAYEPRIMFQTGIRTIEACHIVGLYVNQKFIGSSAGETLAIAEECAALDALRRMFGLRDSREPMVFGEASEKIDYDAHRKEHERIASWRTSLC